MTISTLIDKSCLYCGKSDAKNRCGRCRRVYFCNRDCQRQSWSNHRLTCLPSYIETDHTSCGITQLTKAPYATAGLVNTLPSKCVRLVTKPMQVVEIPVETAEASLKSQKKSKKHKKKRKARSNSMHVASTSVPLPERKNRSASLGAKKHIIWGDVHAREFTRFPGGGSAVPYDGTWALGLGNKIADIELGSVIEVDQLRELELQERAKKLSKSKRRDVRVGETRQFDYRQGVDNPLFSRLSEDERKKVFTQLQMPLVNGASELELPSFPDRRKSRQKCLTGSTSSIDFAKEIDSAGDVVSSTPDFGCVSIEQLDEFAKIRDSRDGACGCSCGELVKKVAKMNVKKLRAFLQEHKVPISGTGKTELMAAAKKVAHDVKNCANADTDCECARNGVPCHSDVCEGCAGDCHNPFQRYEYKSTEVNQYRKMQLIKWREMQQSVGGAASICVA
ncbi:mynd finger domain containing protein [Plasmopara halstedii]|uniref:Mynd finger domain containing protein n=1 Tax=Plasmopara halstedii TaxID=4781 RepID=A0A0N7L7H8_PLAHL|nr:mynd finger domain containing protein [Plasmopara halstedii]CEG47115.1 mynd finger domain containing protein [Plasmopara halstedii]|eukprot:XP_024583484.1 mynd finger domain containing protein [Plasmopara halstedii]